MESSEFRHDVVVTATDIDELGHVSNLVFVRWVQEVARAHSAAVGYDLAAYHRLGAVWVVRRHEVDYVRPAFEGDRIALVTWIDDWRGASSVRRTRMLRDDVEIARASTLWALVSADSGRPQRIPEDMREAFAGTSTLPAASTAEGGR